MNKKGKLLIAGLGNPGRQYKNTPHNVGFEIIDDVANKIEEEISIKQKSTKEYALVEANINERLVLLVKPLLYVNRSGQVINRLLKNYSLQPATSLWVVHDDVDLPLGQLRISYGSGSAGHKGAQDIIAKAGTKDFYRFRVGIRPPRLPDKRPPELMARWVTGKLGRRDKAAFKKIVDFCADIILAEIQDPGLDKFTINYKITGV